MFQIVVLESTLSLDHKCMCSHWIDVVSYPSATVPSDVSERNNYSRQLASNKGIQLATIIFGHSYAIEVF